MPVKACRIPDGAPQPYGSPLAQSVLLPLHIYTTYNIYIHTLLNINIITTPTFAMAGFAFSSSSNMVNFGRSGYNKDGDSEDDKRSMNFGRSGYNKDDGSEDDKKNFGRSGYNKGNDDEDDSRQFNFGRSGYN
ncbi:hypothetical protein F4821DRAFT_256946 [Hypoxylon rubiginosum]|uniref:Uncharacterized protein n=1 Tax=Hypoxylon rubiginosum TaxID=110542 RepID=A0ACC0DA34_9PEZI|nr:hypothetical protein F4821DRAFT_256946 [Hypoxylon rubiginosum]